MTLSSRRFGGAVFGVLVAVSSSSIHAQPATPPAISTAERISVTATRLPEDVDTIPASITILTAEDLAARGVTDLAGALSLVAGIAVAPGGDGGPASSVPEIWGLREFDAFLLVVDGVPWGGAFNPALSTLDLQGVERIEVLRGAAPVMYGATSFVGVIHIIHQPPGTGERGYRASAGSNSSGSASISSPLPPLGGYQQSLQVGAERLGFEDDRTSSARAQLLYRGAAAAGEGRFRLDLAASFVNQEPASPHPRQGRVLSPLVPLDANHNPKDAKIDENRLHLVGGYERPAGGGTWTTNLSLTHSERDTVRGFLSQLSETTNNAVGFEQDLSVDDLYLESYWARTFGERLRVVAGVDALYGKGEAESEIFAYTARLDGGNPQSSSSLARLEEVELEDERTFSGAFAQLEWTPIPRLSVEIGLRLNHTSEDREGEAEPVGEEEPGEEEGGTSTASTTRGSGALGLSFLAWGDEENGIWLFGDVRDTFKPAAIDFGPEAEGDLLKPETAISYEAGVKGQHAGGRVHWQLSAFQMDFENLVVSQLVNGLPGLINAGTQRFEGLELEAGAELPADLHLDLAVSFHEAKFRHFTQLFDGVPTALDGKRLEMSPEDLASLGLSYRPESGLLALVEANYVGDRFLNKRNTALAPSYTTWSAAVGYRFARGELRLEGRNLNDTRPPVAESELGDAQYYRLPARSLQLVWRGTF